MSHTVTETDLGNSIIKNSLDQFAFDNSLKLASSLNQSFGNDNNKIHLLSYTSSQLNISNENKINSTTSSASDTDLSDSFSKNWNLLNPFGENQKNSDADDTTAKSIELLSTTNKEILRTNIIPSESAQYDYSNKILGYDDLIKEHMGEFCMMTRLTDSCYDQLHPGEADIRYIRVRRPTSDELVLYDTEIFTIWYLGLGNNADPVTREHMPYLDGKVRLKLEMLTYFNRNTLVHILGRSDLRDRLMVDFFSRNRSLSAVGGGVKLIMRTAVSFQIFILSNYYFDNANQKIASSLLQNALTEKLQETKLLLTNQLIPKQISKQYNTWMVRASTKSSNKIMKNAFILTISICKLISPTNVNNNQNNGNNSSASYLDNLAFVKQHISNTDLNSTIKIQTIHIRYIYIDGVGFYSVTEDMIKESSNILSTFATFLFHVGPTKMRPIATTMMDLLEHVCILHNLCYANLVRKQ